MVSNLIEIGGATAAGQLPVFGVARAPHSQQLLTGSHGRMGALWDHVIIPSFHLTLPADLGMERARLN